MSRDVSLLHPKLQAVIPRIIAECKSQGLNVLITETWRTKAEQDRLYAQGRGGTAGPIVTNVRYPDSAHCWGVAFDFCRNEKRMEYDDRDGFFERVAAIAKPYGLLWGGDWKNFVDKPHLEMIEFSSVNALKQLYGTPDEFRKSWKEGVNVRYATVKEMPPEYADIIRELMTAGYILGDGNDDIEKRVINLSEDMTRTFVIVDRMIRGGR